MFLSGRSDEDVRNKKIRFRIGSRLALGGKIKVYQGVNVGSFARHGSVFRLDSG